ncbi:hypothetical protein DY000_02054392 [Brassica cretica]|uniref:Uncharacterized protein n=1 Tax=Brassica cretica TaxID=69181 RepID=A0ABQ7AHR5_BRACR|nr:hypothetical protein DY000_02054392 [Brassica cretica]
MSYKRYRFDAEKGGEDSRRRAIVAVVVDLEAAAVPTNIEALNTIMNVLMVVVVVMAEDVFNLLSSKTILPNTLSSLSWLRTHGPGSEAAAALLQTCVQALQTLTTQLFQEERDLNQKWKFLRQIEECFFRQKSHINWLREGDLNTTYFFRICQVRASYNAIRSFLKV